jgi:hypothetical protein
VEQVTEVMNYKNIWIHLAKESFKNIFLLNKPTIHIYTPINSNKWWQILAEKHRGVSSFTFTQNNANIVV